MKRHQLCDVPGCGRTRARWQRLCSSCWPQLPDHIRRGITLNFRADKPAWRAACKQAGTHIATASARMADRQREAFERTERLLGEHS